VSATDYIVNFILLLPVLRQIRETRLSSLPLVLPMLLIAAAAAACLPAVPTAGNDVALEVTLAATGLALGVLCAMATCIRRDADGVARLRAGWVVTSLWVAKISARTCLAYAASDGAGSVVARFSAAHDITSGPRLGGGLVLMALAEVTAGLMVTRLRARRLTAATRTRSGSNALSYQATFAQRHCTEEISPAKKAKRSRLWTSSSRSAHPATLGT
jgi:hypothetical protein